MLAKTRDTVTAIAGAFSAALTEDSGCIVLGDLQEARRHRDSFPNDPTGFEAFVNHVHLPDLLPGVRVRAADRTLLVELGAALVRVWSDRLRPLLRGRAALFYVAGRRTRDITVRFHLDRGIEHHWLDMEDAAFLKRDKVAVFRATEAELTLVAGALQ